LLLRQVCSLAFKASVTRPVPPAFKASEISIALLVLHCTSICISNMAGKLDENVSPSTAPRPQREDILPPHLITNAPLGVDQKRSRGRLKSAELPSTSSSTTTGHRMPIVETAQLSPHEQHSGRESHFQATARALVRRLTLSKPKQARSLHTEHSDLQGQPDSAQMPRLGKAWAQAQVSCFERDQGRRCATSKTHTLSSLITPLTRA
jgi:hypothetical protein